MKFHSTALLALAGLSDPGGGITQSQMAFFIFVFFFVPFGALGITFFGLLQIPTLIGLVYLAWRSLTRSGIKGKRKVAILLLFVYPICCMATNMIGFVVIPLMCK